MHTETLGREGGPDVVCLHGGTGTGHYHWGRVAGALAGRFRVHLPDLPGHGRTPPPPGGRADLRVLSDAVRAALEALGPPVHVAGFSMGGHASLLLATERPELFASLTLVGVSVREHDGLRAWRTRFDPDALEREYPLWTRHLSRLHEPQGGDEAWREVIRRDAAGRLPDLDLDALARLPCPVLLIRGDRDPAVDPAQYAELRARWGERAEELVVPAGGHDVQMTRHGLVAPALADFLGRITA